jgi:hypothetical protein
MPRQPSDSVSRVPSLATRAAGDAAVELEEDVHLVAVGLECREQPRHGRVRLLAQPEPQQRVHRVGEVADPREAVVPVLLPGEVLGQGGGRRGRDGPGGAVDEQLEGERAAVHGVGPGAVPAELGRPALPVLDGAVDALVDHARVRQVQRLVLGAAQADQRPRAGRRRERAPELERSLGVAVARLRGVGAAVLEADQREVDVRGAEHGAVHRVDAGDGMRAEGVARHDGPAHLDRALEAVHATRELAPGESAGHAGHERIGDLDGAGGGAEPRAQHVRAGHVRTLDLEVVVDRAQLDAAPVGGVDDAREDGVARHRRERQPVDLAVACDQRDGAAVADRSVRAQGDVTVLPGVGHRPRVVVEVVGVGGGVLEGVGHPSYGALPRLLVLAAARGLCGTGPVRTPGEEAAARPDA